MKEDEEMTKGEMRGNKRGKQKERGQEIGRA